MYCMLGGFNVEFYLMNIFGLKIKVSCCEFMKWFVVVGGIVVFVLVLYEMKDVLVNKLINDVLIFVWFVCIVNCGLCCLLCLEVKDGIIVCVLFDDIVNNKVGF